MPSRSDRSRSSRVKAPLAPMQCHAGRSPLGRTGITDDEVCWSAFWTTPPTSTPSPRSMSSRLVARGSVPTAPKLRTSAPSRLSTTAVPPAVPAGENRMVSTSWPSEPSGTDSTPITCASRTWTPTVAIFMTSPGCSCRVFVPGLWGVGLFESSLTREVVP